MILKPIYYAHFYRNYPVARTVFRCIISSFEETVAESVAARTLAIISLT